MRIVLLSLLVVGGVCFVGCGDDDTTTPRDSGPAATDSPGGGDPCLGQPEDLMATRGCNGAIPGPQPANTSGGTCTPDSPDPDMFSQGTCGAMLSCWTLGGEGMCLENCMPPTGDFSLTSTSTCPSGFRCFDDDGPTMDGPGTCAPDCAADSDCASGNCDMDSWVCYPSLGGPPPEDGGTPPDAG